MQDSVAILNSTLFCVLWNLWGCVASGLPVSFNSVLHTNSIDHLITTDYWAQHPAGSTEDWETDTSPYCLDIFCSSVWIQAFSCSINPATELLWGAPNIYTQKVSASSAVPYCEEALSQPGHDSEGRLVPRMNCRCAYRFIQRSVAQKRYCKSKKSCKLDYEECIKGTRECWLDGRVEGYLGLGSECDIWPVTP